MAEAEGHTGASSATGDGMRNGLASPQGSVTSVKVAVRVRPLVAMERGQGCQAVMFGDCDGRQVVAGDNRCFRFDHVFGVDSTQEEVYRRTTLPLVERCLDGFNATVLAYGQTGSGKTWTVGNAYTVNGSPEDAGIIPRAVTDIFKRVDQLRAGGVKASVHASFLEVINEEIKDLIGSSEQTGDTAPAHNRTANGGSNGSSGGLALRENMEGEVTVAGLSQHEISGPQDLATLLERGALCRATASTNMNAHSSRSHAICTLSFEIVRPASEETAEMITSSQFHLVDLAGSERAKRTGAEGQRLREGININKGLLALGNVISALSEGAAGGSGAAGFSGGGQAHHIHVPYRDSKLTRLLQSSLGGNAHTVMIACISPADSNMAESMNTLRYAGRAMNIKNTAVKNEGTSGPPVSYAEVVALRKEVRVLQVELVQSRLAGLSGVGFGGSDVPGAGDGREARGAARAAAEEAAELRRGQAALERRVLDATRNATKAVEGEMSARMESDRWRLRCEQVLAVLNETAPARFADLPGWATGAEGTTAAAATACDEGTTADASHGGDRVTSGGVVGSLEKELRQRVFELESQVTELEGKLAASNYLRGQDGTTGDDDAEGLEAVRSSSRQGLGLEPASEAITAQGDCSFSSITSFGDGPEGSPSSHDVEDDSHKAGVEEIRRVDQEIENKERALLMKAEQARAYEQMKGQFEGLLGRLQGEVNSLQTERDALLRKLSTGTVSASSTSRSGGDDGKAHGQAALARVKARVAELEARIKENRKKVLEHQRAERERAAAAKEAERLRAEVAEAKQRRAELQRTHREASTRFMKETRELQLKEARMRRDGERMQWQVKKLQESQERTQAALKRKMEEHSSAIRKMRKLQSQKPQRGRPGGDGPGAGVEKHQPAIKEAKKAELAAWLATEIEEATAVQRAKRALKAQLKLRGDAASKVQALRVMMGTERHSSGGREQAETQADARVSSGQGDARKDELVDLDERIKSASKVIRSLQTFLVAANRSSSTTGTKTSAGAAAGNARWSRLRTPWDNNTALSVLLGEVVKAKVLGMEFAEASSVKDLELRALSLEIDSLRAAAATAAKTSAADMRNSEARGGRAAALQAAVAVAEAEVLAAVGEESSDERNDLAGDEADEGVYEEGERSFVAVSDSDEEAFEEDDEDENDVEDEDEEWLPGRDDKGEGYTGFRPRLRGSASASESPRWSNASTMSLTPGSIRSSTGSAVAAATPTSHLVSVCTLDGVELEANWDDLESHTVVQLKELLRVNHLPVSGKKEVLIERLKSARGVHAAPSGLSVRSPVTCDTSPVSLSCKDERQMIARENRDELVPASESSEWNLDHEAETPLHPDRRGVRAHHRVDQSAQQAKRIQAAGDNQQSSAPDGTGFRGRESASGAPGHVAAVAPARSAKPMAPPRARRPLGDLSNGILCVASDAASNGSSSKSGAHDKRVAVGLKRGVAAVEAMKTSERSVGGGGSAITLEKRKLGADSVTASRGRGAEGATAASVSATNPRRPMRADKSARVLSSGNTRDRGRLPRLGVLEKSASASSASSTANDTKRLKTAGAASARSSTPSFLKPTKSSGAHAAAVQTRPSNGGAGASGGAGSASIRADADK